MSHLVGLRRKRWAATLATGALIAVGAVAPASAGTTAIMAQYAQVASATKPVAKRSVTLTSSTGQPPSGSPKVESVVIVQDVVAKKVTATATFASAPTAADPQVLSVILGKWSGNNCVPSSGGLGMAANAAGEHAAFLQPSTEVTSNVKVSGSTIAMTASGNNSLGSSTWNCGYALTQTSGQGTSPEVDHQVFYADDLKVTYVKKAKLGTSVAASVAPKTGKSAKVKVSVKNTGTATAKKVKVTFTGAKLKYSKKSVSLGSIAPGKTKKVTVRVTMTGNSTRTGKAVATASGKLRSAKTFKVLRYKTTTRPKSLTGKYFWGWKTSYDRGWDNKAVMFVDKKWAYVGFPAKGTPKCTSTVKGCKKYTYNSRTGKVKVGKTKGTVTSKALKLGKQNYAPLSVPKSGTRLNVALLHKDFSGCYGMSYCSTWTERLVLSKNGRFVRSKSSVSSFGVPGVSQSWYTKTSPNERGKYKILSKGRIQFRYDGGKKVTHTIGIEQDVREKAAPQTQGVVIGKVNFYPRD